MKINIKFILISGLCGVVTVMTAATTISHHKDQHFDNLQVLPNNIDPKTLNKIMVDDFEDALGVSCGFCHAVKPDSVGVLDYASDAKPEKQIARQMLKMTLNVNRDYFKIENPMLGTSNVVINCNTCHKGDTFPDQPAPGKN